MKVLSTEGLTKLIQLIKSSFISTSNTVTTNTVTLADVATSGDFDDLINKPTIPTVGNGTVTINQGGTQKGTFTLNQSGNATINLDAGGGGGAVDSVNGQTGVVVLTASDVGALADTTTIPSKTSDLTNDSGFITNSALNGYATETWVGQQGYITGITSSDVTTALGYTPYNSTNPSGYITSSALNGYATETWVGNQGYLTDITSSDVITALTYTPYNGATNPNGYITSADLPTNYVTTDTAQDISGRKTFLGEKAIYFKQLETTNKLGFTLYNPSNAELGALEYRPNTIGSASLLDLNCPQTTGGYVGFRYWGSPAVNIVAPKVATAGNYFIPTHITNGSTTVTANNQGTVDISSLLPDVSGFATQTWVQNQNYLTSSALTDYVTNTSLATTLNGYQPLLESGINIKTINNINLLGNGNIDTREIYTAVFDESTFTDVQNAYNSGKIIKCDFLGNTGSVTCYLVFYDGDYFVFMGENRYREVDNIQYIFLRLDSNDNWIYWRKENADTTLSNVSSIDSNSAVATALDGKVSKSGDTMTGDLTLEQAGFHSLWTDTDSTVTPSTQVNHDPIIFQDANGVGITYLGFERNTDGSYTSKLSTRKTSGGWSTFEVGYNPSGDAYCNFPNTTRVDSKVYNTNNTLLDNGNLSVAEHSYSLSSYLPNDGRVYEIFLEIRGRTSTTSGNSALIYANGGATACNLVYTTTRSSNFTTFCGYGSVYVNSERTLKIKLSGNAITNTIIAIRGYRRIGDNA